jgi:hypothetical protein
MGKKMIFLESSDALKTQQKNVAQRLLFLKNNLFYNGITEGSRPANRKNNPGTVQIRMRLPICFEYLRKISLNEMKPKSEIGNRKLINASAA